MGNPAMKVSFTLKPDQKLILRILSDTGKIHYPVLSRILEAIRHSESNFEAFVKAVADKREIDFRPEWQKPKLTQLEHTIEGLVFVGLIEQSSHPYGQFGIHIGNGGLTDNDIFLTSEGERVAKSIKEERHLIFRPVPTRRTTIFVACAFGYDEIDLLYEKHLFPACRSFHYDAVRVDMTEPKQSITDAILEGITECACVIADLTYARPSVYFEVGLAHGLGIPLLLTCRSDHHRGKADDRKVHFDLEQYKISFWKRTPNADFSWPKNMKPSSRISALVPKRTEE
jgi:hypothetical protein